MRRFYHSGDNPRWLQNRAAASPELFPSFHCFDFFFSPARHHEIFWGGYLFFLVATIQMFFIFWINLGPHGTRVQASDVFNSCVHLAERSRTTPALSVCFSFGHITVDTFAKKTPEEIRGRQRRISALVPGLSGDLLVNTVNTCKQLESLNTSRPLKIPPPKLRDCNVQGAAASV